MFQQPHLFLTRFVHGRDLATCGVNHVHSGAYMDVSGVDVAPGDKGDASEEVATKIDTFRAERGLLAGKDCRTLPSSRGHPARTL